MQQDYSRHDAYITTCARLLRCHVMPRNFARHDNTLLAGDAKTISGAIYYEDTYELRSLMTLWLAYMVTGLATAL